MPVIIEFLKYLIPLILQSKSTLALLILGAIAILSIPPGIIAFYQNESTDRIVAEQVRTRLSIETLTAVLTNYKGKATVAVYTKPRGDKS